MIQNDTIAAVSTGMTNSGIGIVRITGQDAFETADRIYKGKKSILWAESHTIQYGYIVDGEETIDEVLVMLMRGPGTYTGEDTVEINCHGGTYVIKRVLETVIKAGARLAEPGEFTKRAFLNGKMDLSQAEAVMDVIQAEGEYALKSSVEQLKGNIKNKIIELRKKIIYETAFIETALDDPEHISIDGYGVKLKEIVLEMIKEIDLLLDSSEQGRIIKDGIQTVILGRPNAGKSSLLNALSGRERAIVTDIEGTTRDILEERITLHGLCLNVIDTAGIRQSEDLIEQIGVEKAKEYAKNADLILYVADSSGDLNENDAEILDLILDRKNVIVLLNKSDLEKRLTKEAFRKEWMEQANLSAKDTEKIEQLKKIPVLEISAKNKEGLDFLEEQLKEMFFHGDIQFHNEIYITNIRQKDALKKTQDSLRRVTDSINAGLPEDFYSIDLMDAYERLGSITGELIGEDLVNEIFSKFCVGK